MWIWGGNYGAAIDRDMQDVEISLLPSLLWLFLPLTLQLQGYQFDIHGRLPDLTRTDRSAYATSGSGNLMLNLTILMKSDLGRDEKRQNKVRANGQFAPWEEL